MKFVIYEVWTRSKIVEADSASEAYRNNTPVDDMSTGLSLCNWHAVPVDDPPQARFDQDTARFVPTGPCRCSDAAWDPTCPQHGRHVKGPRAN